MGSLKSLIGHWIFALERFYLLRVINEARKLRPDSSYYLAQRAQLYAERGKHELAKNDVDMLRFFARAWNTI